MAGCSSSGASNDYITISKYEGVEVEAVDVPEITDESVENNIQKVLEGFAVLNDVDRVIQDGDVVTIDYATYVNGSKVDSETASANGYQLTIGNNSLYDGFDDNLIGRKKGESFSLNNTFSADYSDKSLAGQDALLEITITNVQEEELPDLTDEFVQTISQKSETVEEYRKEMRELLEENNDEYVKSELLESVWKKVLDNTEVKEYPEDSLEDEKQSFYEYYQSGADYYDMEFADFIDKYLGVTEDGFEEYAEEQAKSNVKEDLVVALICEKENIKLSEEEIEEAKVSLAEELGYESVEEMEKEAPEDAVQRYIMRDEVKEWLVEKCIQVKGY